MHGLAVREQPDQLIVAHARPGAHIADVEMHEGRPRCRVVADAAALHPHADLADVRHGHSRHGGVHRLAQHMLRKFGDRAGARPQHGVGLGRTIGGNDGHDLALGSGAAIGLPDHVEQSRVHFDGLVVSPVAQKPVELLQRRRIVLAVDQIGRGYRLPGMHIKEVYGAGVAVGRGGLGHRRRRGRQQCRQRSQDEGEIPGRISGCADAGALQQNVSLPFPMRRRPGVGAHLAASRRHIRATQGPRDDSWGHSGCPRRGEPRNQWMEPGDQIPCWQSRLAVPVPPTRTR